MSGSIDTLLLPADDFGASVLPTVSEFARVMGAAVDVVAVGDRHALRCYTKLHADDGAKRLEARLQRISRRFREDCDASGARGATYVRIGRDLLYALLDVIKHVEGGTLVQAHGQPDRGPLTIARATGLDVLLLHQRPAGPLGRVVAIRMADASGLASLRLAADIAAAHGGRLQIVACGLPRQEDRLIEGAQRLADMVAVCPVDVVPIAAVDSNSSSLVAHLYDAGVSLFVCGSTADVAADDGLDRTQPALVSSAFLVRHCPSAMLLRSAGAA